ncbi:MAG: ABC transporter substrate-binding protein [Sulfobacillus sp.]
MGQNWRRLTSSVLIVSSLGLALVSCGANPGAPPHPVPMWASANRAIIALPPFVTLNAFVPILPLIAYNSYNSQTNLLMYKPLVFITNTDAIDFHRSIATSVVVSNNSQTFTVTLNPKWTWSNGSPVTANDVAFTAVLEAASCAANAPYTYGGCGVGGVNPLRTVGPDGIGWSSVKAPSATTFSITVTRPVNAIWFEHNALGQLLPMPASVWETAAGVPVTPATSLTAAEIKTLLNYMGGSTNPNNVMDNPTAAPFAVVDGPYLFKTLVPNDYWEFTANPNYDGHMATIKTLIYQYYASAQAGQTALERGQVSSGYLTAASLAKHQTSIAGYRLRTGPPPFCTFYINLNLSPLAASGNGIGLAFQELAVRQALQLGIDQAAYIHIMGAGYGVQEYGPIPLTPGLSIYNARAMPAPLTYNPARGKALLLANGWSEQNGVMTKSIDGKPVSLAFTLPYGLGASHATTKFLNLLSQDWAVEGIKMTPSRVDPMFAFNDQQGPLVTATWAASYDGGWCYQPNYYPTGGPIFTAAGAANLGDFTDPTLQRLISATYAPGSAAQARASLTAYLAYTARILPGVLWLPDLTTPTEISPWLHGSIANYNQVEALNFPNYWTITTP